MKAEKHWLELNIVSQTVLFLNAGQKLITKQSKEF